MVAGVGECTRDGMVSETEFRCHSVIDQVLRPDLPAWFSGSELRVSVGFTIDAVPAVIVE